MPVAWSMESKKCIYEKNWLHFVFNSTVIHTVFIQKETNLLFLSFKFPYSCKSHFEFYKSLTGPKTTLVNVRGPAIGNIMFNMKL